MVLFRFQTDWIAKKILMNIGDTLFSATWIINKISTICKAFDLPRYVKLTKEMHISGDYKWDLKHLKYYFQRIRGTLIVAISTSWIAFDHPRYIESTKEMYISGDQEWGLKHLKHYFQRIRGTSIMVRLGALILVRLWEFFFLRHHI